MGEAKPRLVELDPRAASAKPPRPAQAPRDGAPGPGRRWLVPALAALLAVCGLGLAGQWSRNAQLERQVQALSGELGRARGELEAHRAHLAEVRGRVSNLAARFGALEDVLKRGPAPSVDAPPAEPD